MYLSRLSGGYRLRRISAGVSGRSCRIAVAAGHPRTKSRTWRYATFPEAWPRLAAMDFSTRAAAIPGMPVALKNEGEPKIAFSVLRALTIQDELFRLP